MVSPRTARVRRHPISLLGAATLVTLVTASLTVPPAAGASGPGVSESTSAQRVAARASTVPARTPAFNGLVRAIANRGPVVYVGGDFTRVADSAGTHVRRYAAAFDARTGRVLPWNPRANAGVYDLAVTRTSVFLGGAFTKVKGKPRARIAQVTRGGRAKPMRFRHRVNGTVITLSHYNGRLFAGGTFTAVDGKPRGQLAAFTAKGRLSKSWRPIARKGPVRDLVATAAGVYVAGHFHHVNQVPESRRLALLDNARGGVVRRFDPPMQKPVFEIAVGGSRVYAGVGGSGGGYVAAFARGSGAQQWLRRFDGDVASVALHSDGALYVGGHFHEACDTDFADPENGECLGSSQIRNRMAALTRSGAVLAWNPGADTTVGVTAIDSIRKHGVAFGGTFTTVGGTARLRLALFR